LQALWHLGKDAVDATVLSRIRKALSPSSRSQLLRDARYATDWIAAAVRTIAGNLPKNARNDLRRSTDIPATAGGAAGNRTPSA
jgi:hypothetical protein